MLKFQFKRLKNLKNFFKNRRFNKKLGSKLLLSLTLLQLIIFPSTSSAAEGFTPPHKPSSSGSKSRNFFGDQNNRPIDKKGDSRGSSGDSGGSSGGKKGGNSGGNGEYSPSEYSTAKAKEDVTNLSKRIDGV